MLVSPWGGSGLALQAHEITFTGREMEITFWGAAQTVTGSMHEVRANERRILLDCGMYQGRRRDAWERNSTFPFPGSSVDAVILSHAHIDHSGNLPTLGRNGFSGPIHTTSATTDLCRYMLPDSGHIQEKDAEFVNKRKYRRRKIDPTADGADAQPLYTVADAEKLMPQFQNHALGETVTLADGLSYSTVDAGHMLGSTSVHLQQTSNGKTIKLGFSGDIGRENLPIIPDPQQLPAVDYLIMESTYGDRLHKDIGSVADKLAEAVNRACSRGGKIVAPAFAVGRTQQLVLLLNQLMTAQRIPSIPIFVDSPLAVSVTTVFREHEEAWDSETAEFGQDGDPFGFFRLRYVRSVEESKALNDLRGPFLIISASGMCEAGRVLHHLRNTIEDPRNMVLITGFQAEHTLGRRIVEKRPEVPIFGDPMQLRAEVVKFNELSGHADQGELLTWLKPLTPGLKRVFLVHGELTQSQALKARIEQEFKIPVTIPARGESFQLN